MLKIVVNDSSRVPRKRRMKYTVRLISLMSLDLWVWYFSKERGSV
jgi:hypothetical protein